MKFHSVTIWLTRFPTKPWGFIHEAEALSACRPQRGGSASRLTFLVLLFHRIWRPVPQNLLFGMLWGVCQCPGGQMSLWSWFCTAGSVCYQFLAPHFLRGRHSEFGWQVRILEFPSHSKPLLQGKGMGIAAWPLISAAFSFNPSYKK